MTVPTGGGAAAGEYCRAIEAYLCRENGGHLVRIVGPVFQTVCGWHARGIPFTVVQQGVDRMLARQRARPTAPPRRPVRIEFCEADVLDAFDAWRRAVGVGMAGDRGEIPGAEADAPAAHAAVPPEGAALRPTRAPSLVAHVDRAMQRLTQCALATAVPAAARPAISEALAALDQLRPSARAARGPARASLFAALAALDDALGEQVVAALPPDLVSELTRAARAEVAPFAARMAASDRAAAEQAALQRLVRDRFRLPELVPAGA